jgi:Tfp pilus assembly protein PilO
MIKINKAQKQQLIAVGVGAVAVMTALWYFVVRAQHDELAATIKNCDTMRVKLKDEHEMVYQAEQIALDLTNCLEKLHQREAGFAPEHEPYSWMRGVMDRFYLPPNGRHPYKTVSNIDFKQPEITDKGGIIAAFPYKWARFHITGEGRYHDFGKFIADFENAFPCFRIQDLDISASLTGIRTDPYTLSFSFDIIAPQVPATETK